MYICNLICIVAACVVLATSVRSMLSTPVWGCCEAAGKLANDLNCTRTAHNQLTARTRALIRVPAAAAHARRPFQMHRDQILITSHTVLRIFIQPLPWPTHTQTLAQRTIYRNTHTKQRVLQRIKAPHLFAQARTQHTHTHNDVRCDAANEKTSGASLCAHVRV